MCGRSCGDARAVILDRDADLGAARFLDVRGGDADPAVAAAVFDGVGHQVLHRRAQRRGVARPRAAGRPSKFALAR